jgi:hypothetical protein
MTGILVAVVAVYFLGYAITLIVTRLASPGSFSFMGRRRSLTQTYKESGAALLWPLSLYRLIHSTTEGHQKKPIAHTQDGDSSLRQHPDPSQENVELDIPKYGIIDDTDS